MKEAPNEITHRATAYFEQMGRSLQAFSEACDRCAKSLPLFVEAYAESLARDRARRRQEAAK